MHDATISIQKQEGEKGASLKSFLSNEPLPLLSSWTLKAFPIQGSLLPKGVICGFAEWFKEHFAFAYPCAFRPLMLNFTAC